MEAGETGAPKKRKRRRRRKPGGGDKPGGGESSTSGEGTSRQPGPGGTSARPGGGRGGDSRGRRGGGGRGGRDADGKKRRRRKEKAPAAAAPLRGEKIDTKKSVDLPLNEAEVEQMKEHLRFISKYRKDLRLSFNAKEDLLVNGAREPSHRGVCRHLLGKIDRSVINAALTRMSTPDARVKLLAGVVRFSHDVAVAVQYLEALSEAESRKDAAAALTAGLRAIDFAQSSAAQTRRVLELIVTLFDNNERPQLLFSLLQSKTFRRAFDESSEGFPSALADILMPLRATWAAMKNKPAVGTPEDLQRGVDLLVRGGAIALRNQPESARRRLLQLATELASSESLDGVVKLLNGFPDQSRDFSGTGMDLVRRFLQEHRDAEAKALLDRLVAAHRQFRLPAQWRDALAQPRVGRIALEETTPGMRRGLWLDQQRPVVVRVGVADDRETFERESALHAGLALPALAPLLSHGVSDEGAPYRAVAAMGRPATQIIGSSPAQLAFDGATLLWTLATVGVRLPDAEPRRFSVADGSRLWLIDMSGATEDPHALEHHLTLARGWLDHVRRPYRGPNEWTALLRAVA